MPAGATTGNIVVTVGGVASNGVSFTVVRPAPSITTRAPTSGTVGHVGDDRGGELRRDQGDEHRHLQRHASATPTTWSATSIVVPVPAGATTGNIVVTVGGVASNGVSFTVGVPPTSPITLTQHAGLSTAAACSTTLAFPANNVAGNFIVVAARARFAGPDLHRQRCPGQRLPARRSRSTTAPTIRWRSIYAENIAAGPNTVTVAVVDGPASIRLAILEYAGIARANALDVTATAARIERVPEQRVGDHDGPGRTS